jgi:serine/threonine protein kinase
MLVGANNEAKRRAMSTRSDCYGTTLILRSFDVTLMVLIASLMIALGMVLYEIATSRVPFEGVRRSPELLAEIAEGRRPVLSADVHPGLVEVIQGLWHMDPYARLTAQLAAERLAVAIRSQPLLRAPRD